MPVFRVGSVTTAQDSAQSSSYNVVIPAGTDTLVQIAVGFENALNWMPANPFTLDGINLATLQRTDVSTSVGHVWLGVYLMPPVGTYALAWDWGLAPDEGIHFCTVLYAGVDLGAPIRDSGKTTAVGNPDLTGLTAYSGDMMCGGVYSYTSDPTVTDDSQTLLAQMLLYNQCRAGMAEKLGGTGFYYTSASGGCACAAVILAERMPRHTTVFQMPALV